MASKPYQVHDRVKVYTIHRHPHLLEKGNDTNHVHEHIHHAGTNDHTAGAPGHSHFTVDVLGSGSVATPLADDTVGNDNDSYDPTSI